jgi:hypothetical protein
MKLTGLLIKPNNKSNFSSSSTPEPPYRKIKKQIALKFDYLHNLMFLENATRLRNGVLQMF